MMITDFNDAKKRLAVCLGKKTAEDIEKYVDIIWRKQRQRRKGD